MKIYREVGTLTLITQCDKEGYVRPVYEIEVDEAEPIRHGHWEKVYGDHISMGHRPWVVCCSVCDRVGTESNYCPNCGAKMDLNNTYTTGHNENETAVVQDDLP